MKITSITYPTELSSIKDIEDDNIDVFVELEDEFTYTVVVTTPKNLIKQMNSENLNYIPAGPPQIIVKTLNEENIRNGLEDFAKDNAYWLKLYFLAGDFEDSTINHCLNKIKDEFNEIANAD